MNQLVAEEMQDDYDEALSEAKEALGAAEDSLAGAYDLSVELWPAAVGSRRRIDAARRAIILAQEALK